MCNFSHTKKAIESPAGELICRPVYDLALQMYPQLGICSDWNTPTG